MGSLPPAGFHGGVLSKSGSRKPLASKGSRKSGSRKPVASEGPSKSGSRKPVASEGPNHSGSRKPVEHTSESCGTALGVDCGYAQTQAQCANTSIVRTHYATHTMCYSARNRRRLCVSMPLVSVYAIGGPLCALCRVYTRMTVCIE